MRSKTYVSHGSLPSGKFLGYSGSSAPNILHERGTKKGSVVSPVKYRKRRCMAISLRIERHVSPSARLRTCGVGRAWGGGQEQAAEGCIELQGHVGVDVLLVRGRAQMEPQPPRSMQWYEMFDIVLGLVLFWIWWWDGKTKDGFI